MDFVKTNIENYQLQYIFFFLTKIHVRCFEYCASIKMTCDKALYGKKIVFVPISRALDSMGSKPI